MVLSNSVSWAPKRLYCHLSVLITKATYPSCSKGCCHQWRGWNAKNKWAQPVLTCMATTSSALFNGLRFTLRQALLNYTLRLQGYRISFLQTLHQGYHLWAICCMGEPSPWHRRPALDMIFVKYGLPRSYFGKSSLHRSLKLSLSMFKVVFVEVIFIKIAFIQLSSPKWPSSKLSSSK